MQYDVQKCEILLQREIASGIFDFIIDAQELAQIAQPGQFVHILVPGKTLRRPISICDIDRDNGTLRLVFQIRGEGTEILSHLKMGELLDIIGPLGNGFEVGDTSRKALFVGGGIGVPPLLAAAKAFGENATVALGFRSQDASILVRDFALAGCRVHLATDDGSTGYHGVVTDCIRDTEADVLFACGPAPMLKGVCRLAEERGLPCQISLEERMACGVGACLVCACKLLRDGKEHYGRVCKDGPVFDYKTVIW